MFNRNELMSHIANVIEKKYEIDNSEFIYYGIVVNRNFTGQLIQLQMLYDGKFPILEIINFIDMTKDAMGCDNYFNELFRIFINNIDDGKYNYEDTLRSSQIKKLIKINNDIITIISKYDYYFNGVCEEKLKIDSSIKCSLILANDLIVLGLNNGEIIVRDYKKLLFKLKHDSQITCLAILSEDKIVSGSTNGTLIIWNIITQECEKILNGHYRSISCVLVHKEKIISASWDNTIKIWDPLTGKCEDTLKGHSNCINCLDVQDDYLISGGWDDKIIIWNLKTKSIEKSFNFDDIDFTCPLSDNKILVVSDTNYANILNVKDSSKEKTHKIDQIGCISKVLNNIIIGTLDGSLLLLEDSKIKEEIYGTNKIKSILSLPNNEILISNDKYGLVIYNFDDRIFKSMLTTNNINVFTMKSLSGKNGYKIIIFKSFGFMEIWS